MNRPTLMSTMLLLASNVVALVCAVVFRWNLFEIITLYWIQGLFIGVSQYFKIQDMVAYAQHPERKRWLRIHGTALMKKGAEKGFAVIYVIFWLPVGIGLLVIYLQSRVLSVSLLTIVLVSITFAISHSWSYRTNKKKDERRKIDIYNTLMHPLVRIVLPLHIFIVATDFDSSYSFALTVTWMLIKTAADVGLHFHEHESNRLVP